MKIYKVRKDIVTLLTMLVLFVGCATNTPIKTTEVKPQEPVKVISEIKTGTKRLLWSTYYKTPSIKSGRGNFCLRDENAKCITKGIGHDQKCFIQMQGSGVVDGVMYAYKGQSSRGIPKKDDCKVYGGAYRGSEKVRFYSSRKYKYGKGSFNNNLVPFVSIACPKAYPDNHKFYIPSAKGVKLPDGNIHNGIFVCHDRGGAIEGNHIDTFLGLIDYSENWKMNDWARASKYNPFKHVKSDKRFTFEAYDVVEVSNE